MDLDSMLPDDMPAPPQAEQIDWSPMQEAIFSETANSDVNLSVEAVAGSGKTTTILECMRRLPPGSDVLFLAFSKAIVRTLASKIPISTDAKTMNGLGHGLMMRKLKSEGKSVKLNNYRLWDLARSTISEEQWEEYGTSLVRLVSLGRANALGIIDSGDAQDFSAMLGDYDIEIPWESEMLACRQASVLLKKLNEIKEEFAFDDQLYLPILWESKFPRYDCVFVDEAQDLSHIQHMMLEALAREGARIIAVGDSRQAIYGFRGADGKSMSNLADKFEMHLLPLSISYRCPKSVVREAQLIVYHIKAHEASKEGSVEYLDEYPKVEDYPAPSMILCRTNGPIFTLALEFLLAKVPCRVMSSFGKDLIKFVKTFEVKTAQELQKELAEWRDIEVKKAEERKWFGKARLVQDKYDALVPFCEIFGLRIEVVAALQQLLTCNTGPTLSTIHKAKGLEADTVYILRPDLLPAPFAKTASAIEQEMNLKYVAITRAMNHLKFLPEDA